MAIRQNLWPSRRAKTTQCLPCLSETAHNRAPNARFMTERDKQELHSFCEGSPVLSEEVPARLPCGFLMTEYRVVCSGCRSDIPMENAWVRRARHEYSQHSIETWDVRGVCTSCRMSTSTYVRFRSNGTFDTIIGHTWRRGRISGASPSLLRRLLTKLRGLLVP